MNAMPYAQPYPTGQGAAFGQVIKRQMSDSERQMPASIYRNFQKNLGGMAVFCLVLFVFGTYVLPAIITDPITYDSVSMTLSIFMLVFGLVAIGMSVSSVVIRKKIENAMRDGTAIEVIGPAYRTGGMGKVQSWTVGPISIMQARGLQGMMQEGMPTSVLCIPRMKSAIAINNRGLKQAARIMFPPNLEMMAVPMEASALSATSQVPQDLGDEELPPPPPPD